jgi:hypothetical protein
MQEGGLLKAYMASEANRLMYEIKAREELAAGFMKYVLEKRGEFNALKVREEDVVAFASLGENIWQKKERFLAVENFLSFAEKVIRRREHGTHISGTDRALHQREDPAGDR